MSNFALLFPSKWLAAADLEGQDKPVQIKQIVASEEVGQSKDKRPILYFNGVVKGMVLNKTNAKRIAKLYGADTDEWVGEWITLYPSECDFGDETVPCLRVRPEAPNVNKKRQAADDESPEHVRSEPTEEELEEMLRQRRARKAATA